MQSLHQRYNSLAPLFPLIHRPLTRKKPSSTYNSIQFTKTQVNMAVAPKFVPSHILSAHPTEPIHTIELCRFSNSSLAPIPNFNDHG
jgi:hypothetical protein